MKFTPLLLAVVLAFRAHASTVTILSVPNNGVQPQALVDAQGVLHLVFLAGPAGQSDVFHTTLDAKTQTFAKPQRINKTQGNAVATGTIRGAQCALGRDGRLHIVWNGTLPAGADGKRRMDVLYTHTKSNGTFEPERPLMHTGIFLDGGATIAADASGNVYALWHAAPLGTVPGRGGELARTVYVATSHNDGQTFATETPCSASATGVCACCSMRAIALPTGELLALYRSADGTSRDMQVLRSTDQAASFTRTELQPWPINACPMSSSSLESTPRGLFAAWETDNTIWMANLASASSKPRCLSSNGSKHPSLAQNERGETLIAWAQGTGWQRGGTLAWSLLDADGGEIEKSETQGKERPGNAAPETQTPAKDKRDFLVPVWSYPAAAHLPSLGFLVIH